MSMLKRYIGSDSIGLGKAKRNPFDFGRALAHDGELPRGYSILSLALFVLALITVVRSFTEVAGCTCSGR
jgi:hypothetical protein